LAKLCLSAFHQSIRVDYVTLQGGELTFGAAEASESVVIWTRGRFEVIPLSD